MSIERMSRRLFFTRSAGAALATPLFWTAALRAAMPQPAAATAVEKDLDAYIVDYMRTMNAPGMALGLTDSSKVLRTAGYGFADVDKRIAVNERHLFQIGSITKSFVALVLLQMRDEGKLDLQTPVLDYLPELPIDARFGPITIHHLLTHTSGLPNNLGVFLGDPDARLVQSFKPGEHFHYCNTGFGILGLLAEKLDGCPWRHCVQARILTPLEMSETAGVISTASRGRTAVGYQPFWDDQVYPRQGRLSPAPNLVMDDTAGCIASTPGDMARYARMLLNHGQGPHKRIVSEQSFALMSTPYIKAPELSETASYGYGIAVDTLDGHKILRHTGGMVAFASSIHVDLDGSVAAFASINAMQGYRPTAVTEYAVRLLRAEREAKTLPAAPAIANPLELDNAADYAGTFAAGNGQNLEIAVEGKQLFLADQRNRIPLQHTHGDNFISTTQGVLANHTFIFGRAQPESPKSGTQPVSVSAAGNGDSHKQPGPVVEVSYGSVWYVNTKYSGPRSFTVPQEYAALVGRYRSESPWGGDAFAYVLKGQLMLDGNRLHRIGGWLFRLGDEEWMPDTAEFLCIFEGKPRILRIAGMDFWRLEID
ncbi:MAG TPA: serine hydrolase domain-containing protein [Terriglobales bacterium]|nr:serine hydrolase domain-containing protein [Terriglobales bacterium]